MNPYTQLARKSIEYYLKNKKALSLSSDLPQELLNKKAGVFVSLHNKKDDSLRGCIGTITPMMKNIASEIIANSIAAATADPRFPPLELSELPDITISVDVLEKPEPIASSKSLDPQKYGVIVKCADGRTGLLLPDIEGVNDPNYQVAIACQKAGISPTETIYLYRFTVERHKE